LRTMRLAIMLFTRDLRLRDNPARGTGPATFSAGIRLAAATRVEKMAAL
jgi:hypothetical protein